MEIIQISKESSQYNQVLDLLQQFQIHHPLSELAKSDKLIDGFGEMLPVFTNNAISEIYYERTADDFKTIYC